MLRGVCTAKGGAHEGREGQPPLPRRLPARPLRPTMQPRCCPAARARREGTIFAYAVSYDWSRGYADDNPATAKNYILLHQPQEAEVKSRARVTGRR